jgi:uncharacterized damage-inducible protein DinB
MLNTILAQFYERDLRQLIEEINLFPTEADLWRTTGTITNSAGNLILHLIGGMNHHICRNIGGIAYERDLEFSQKDVPRDELIAGLESLIIRINQTLAVLTPEQLEGENPAFFDRPGVLMQYVFIQLLGHLNYHRGQVNYLRRALEKLTLFYRRTNYSG